MAANIMAQLVDHQLLIEGTDSADTIIVRQVGDQIGISGTTQRFNAKELTSISIRSLGGNDVGVMEMTC